MKFLKQSLGGIMVLVVNVGAWVMPNLSPTFSRGGVALRAIDYNDPVVAEEFAKVQPMDFEDVEDELQRSGIRVPATMNDMEAKLMLCEMRLIMSGRLKGEKKKEKPKKGASPLQEALYSKPAFEEFYNDIKAQGDTNSLNVIAEYVNNPQLATQRYGKDYKPLLRRVDAALKAPPPVKSTTIKFSGFPSNMGEAGCKMTLESIGPVLEFECKEDEDFPMVLTGKVTFEDIESARRAVEQYAGMDMGMGTTLELVSV